MGVSTYCARNPSEEIFLKGVLNAVVVSSPALEDNGAPTSSSLVHLASEELFSDWISNTDNNQRQANGLSILSGSMSSKHAGEQQTHQTSKEVSWFTQNYQTRSRSSDMKQRYTERQKSSAHEVFKQTGTCTISSMVATLKNSLERRKLVETSPAVTTFMAGDGDCTKRRRVERKRMMIEAKGRSQAPPATDPEMQEAIKRCECLEKEVRSLKLTLASMNRNDSEQTKRIEQLEEHNQTLAREKYGLLEQLNSFH